VAVMMTTVPPHERPRGRLLACGVEVLSERELLALILRSGTNGASALDLAAELLADYGNVAALAAARPEELQSARVSARRRLQQWSQPFGSAAVLCRVGVRNRQSFTEP